MFGLIIGIVLLAVFIGGFRIIRPVEVALHERFGKYQGQKSQGLTWIIPFVDKLYKVNITETMADVPEQYVITKDDLNAKVDAVVYYKVKNAQKAVYEAFDYEEQITSLARTTLRDIVGKMTLSEANSKRDAINQKLEQELDLQTDAWGISIVRVELQEITPPRDVANSMNQVVIAEREKIAAINKATATETLADGDRRAAIKKAEGSKQATILKAQGEADAIKLVNESAQKYFKNAAVDLEKLKTAQIALQSNTKYVLDSSKNLTTVLSEVAGVTPIKGGRK